MEQQLELIQKEKLIIPKPSELLLEAHLEGVKKHTGNFSDGNGAYCARGIITKKIQRHPVLNRMFVWDEDFIAYSKYGDKKLTPYNENSIGILLEELVLYNDGPENPTFLEMSKWLEERGL